MCRFWRVRVYSRARNLRRVGFDVSWAERYAATFSFSPVFGFFYAQPSRQLTIYHSITQNSARNLRAADSGGTSGTLLTSFFCPDRTRNAFFEAVESLRAQNLLATIQLVYVEAISLNFACESYEMSQLSRRSVRDCQHCVPQKDVGGKSCQENINSSCAYMVVCNESSMTLSNARILLPVL